MIYKTGGQKGKILGIIGGDEIEKVITLKLLSRVTDLN